MMDQLKSVKAADGFLLVIDEFGKMIYVSESVLQHIGFRSLDLNGQSWFSLLHPDDQVYSRAHLRQAVTRCNLVPASPSCPVQSTDAETGAGACRSSLTVRLLQGTRPAKRQSASSCQLDQSPQPTTEPSVDKSDVSMKDDSFIYCPFHFSGAARVIKTNNESNGTTGWSRNVVWVAVGRSATDIDSRLNESETVPSSPTTLAALQPSTQDPIPDITPTHFVMRHDLTGRISYVDQRCQYFTGHDPEDLIGQVIFDHLVQEDVRYLSYQYNQLRAGCESIAVVYRLRSARKNDGSDTYFNCRAYLTLNPVTFQADQITSLAAAISNQEGQAEISKQTMRLFHTQSDTPSRKNSQKQSFHSDHQTKVSVTCSAQHKAGSVGSDKENCQLEPGTTKSPLQSPDSNTHPIDISPISTASNANVGGPLELDQVAIIDSQYSPSKHTNEEENAPANPLSVTSPTLSPAIANIKLNATQEKAPSRKQTSHSNHSSSKAPKAILNGAHSNHQMGKFEERDHSRKAPHETGNQLDNYFYPSGASIDHNLEHKPNGRIPNTMYHDQLREKHTYLEESIRNQQQQLQMLQQKLIDLANQGAGLYPMQMQLQNPLNKVMELQARVGRHREEAIQQRSLVDGRLPPYSPPGVLSRRNSTPQLAMRRIQNQPTSGRHGQGMEETGAFEMPPSLPNQLVGPLAFSDYESGRRSAGVISPPFVDMAEQQSSQNLSHGPMNDPLDALYSTLEMEGDTTNLGPDFEEKLRELEMLFTPNFTVNQQNPNQLPPCSPAVQQRSSENPSSYASLTVTGNGS